MINSDINPRSRQKKTPLWSARFPKGASRRTALELFTSAFGDFLFNLFLKRKVFSVWSGGTCLSFSLHTRVFVTFVTLDKHCDTSRLFNPKQVEAGHFLGLLTEDFQRNLSVGRFVLQMTFEECMQMSLKVFFLVFHRHVWGGVWHALQDGHVAGRNHREDEGQGETSDVESPVCS